MATYLILNCIILLMAFIFLGREAKRPSKAWMMTFAVLIVLTLVFDNILIGLGMYSYADEKILGIHVWRAPIEDFMYAILAVILVPALWHKIGANHAG